MCKRRSEVKLTYRSLVNYTHRYQNANFAAVMFIWKTKSMILISNYIRMFGGVSVCSLHYIKKSMYHQIMLTTDLILLMNQKTHYKIP